MINPEVKGTLAKLLATENLTVEHRKVSTAYFDVEKRILCLPIWKTASNTVYDLLVGHEVGHALYTPNKGLDGINKAFVNVLEDVRIEKMMKETYPGLRKSFFQGYTELWQDDFFGVNEEDITKLPFIDRINLFYKGNPEIEFTDEEQVYVDRAANTKTFEDVLKLAEDLYGRAEDIEDKKMDIPLEMESLESPDAGDGDVEVTPNTNNQASGDGEDGDQSGSPEISNEQQPGETESGSGVGGENAKITTGQQSFGQTDHDETLSITQEAFNQALETLIDDNAKEWVYINLPTVNLDEIVVGHKEIQEDLEKVFIHGERQIDRYSGWMPEDEVEYKNYVVSEVSKVRTKYESYKKSAQKSVNYLVKQFEMKKSADDYKRQSTSRTGVIDTNSLYKYKLTDDIFKKITVIPDGKNHGLVMHIDWSGSMSHILLDTLKQTYNLIWFCRKAGIPFRVLAFQDSYHGRSENENTGKEGDLNIHDSFKLLEFFSSKQNKQSLERSMFMIWCQVSSMCYGSNLQASYKYGLGGTPLAEAVLCTRQLVEKMKKEENIQKVNVVCLTDGEANPMAYNDFYDPDYEGMEGYMRRVSLCHSHGKVFYLRDPKTGFSKKINHSPYTTTREIVGFHREITDYNWIGIRICSKSDLGRAVRANLEYTPLDLDKKWKREKFFSISKQAGFSESIFIPNKNLGDETEDLSVNQKGEVATKAELQRAFKKHMGSKMTNKTVLNKFIEQIA